MTQATLQPTPDENRALSAKDVQPSATHGSTVMTRDTLGTSQVQNVTADPDAQIFDDMMELEDTATLGGEEAMAASRRRSSMADTMEDDDNQSTLSRLSLVEQLNQMIPNNVECEAKEQANGNLGERIVEDIDVINDISADCPEQIVKTTKLRSKQPPRVDPTTGKPKPPARAHTKMFDLNRNQQLQAIYAKDMVNQMVSVMTGKKEVPDVANGPAKVLPKLEDPGSYGDEWLQKPFESIVNLEGKATDLQIQVSYENAQKRYPPLKRAPQEEFYKGKSADLAPGSDYQSICRTLDLQSTAKARVAIIHDSCYPTESLPDLTHMDTFTMSTPRATPMQMANAAEIVMRATGSNPSILLPGTQPASMFPARIFLPCPVLHELHETPV